MVSRNVLLLASALNVPVTFWLQGCKKDKENKPNGGDGESGDGSSSAGGEAVDTAADTTSKPEELSYDNIVRFDERKRLAKMALDKKNLITFGEDSDHIFDATTKVPTATWYAVKVADTNTYGSGHGFSFEEKRLITMKMLREEFTPKMANGQIKPHNNNQVPLNLPLTRLQEITSDNMDVNLIHGNRVAQQTTADTVVILRIPVPEMNGITKNKHGHQVLPPAAMIMVELYHSKASAYDAPRQNIYNTMACAVTFVENLQFWHDVVQRSYWSLVAANVALDMDADKEQQQNDGHVPTSERKNMEGKVLTSIDPWRFTIKKDGHATQRMYHQNIGSNFPVNNVENLDAIEKLRADIVRNTELLKNSLANHVSSILAPRFPVGLAHMLHLSDFDAGQAQDHVDLKRHFMAPQHFESTRNGNTMVPWDSDNPYHMETALEHMLSQETSNFWSSKQCPAGTIETTNAAPRACIAGGVWQAGTPCEEATHAGPLCRAKVVTAKWQDGKIFKLLNQLKTDWNKLNEHTSGWEKAENLAIPAAMTQATETSQGNCPTHWMPITRRNLAFQADPVTGIDQITEPVYGNGLNLPATGLKFSREWMTTGMNDVTGAASGHQFCMPKWIMMAAFHKDVDVLPKDKNADWQEFAESASFTSDVYGNIQYHQPMVGKFHSLKSYRAERLVVHHLGDGAHPAFSEIAMFAILSMHFSHQGRQGNVYNFNMNQMRFPDVSQNIQTGVGYHQRLYFTKALNIQKKHLFPQGIHFATKNEFVQAGVDSFATMVDKYAVKAESEVEKEEFKSSRPDTLMPTDIKKTEYVRAYVEE